MPAITITVQWHPSDNPNTIWAKLRQRLGREPTNDEAAAEVRRILSDASKLSNSQR